MAHTAFASGSAQAVNWWSKQTFAESLAGTQHFKDLLGKGDSAIIQKLVELEKDAGDVIKYDLLMKMSGTGVTGDNQLRDSEEALTYHQDTVTIDQLRNGHEFRRMSQQRTVHDLREDASRNLAMWFAEKYESYMMRALCGDTSLTHGQTATAPAAASRYVVSGDAGNTGVIATDEAAISNNDQISLADLDYAKEKAETASPPMRKAKYDGGDYYVVLLDPRCAVDLRLNVSGSTYTKWQDIQQYANSRGLKNPIFTNSLGVYNGMILKESHYCYNPTGYVRRNLLLGAQAGVFAVGNAYDRIEQNKFGKNLLMRWFEGYDDHDNQKLISVSSIFGVNKSVFNSLDFGTIVITSYGAAHG